MGQCCEICGHDGGTLWTCLHCQISCSHEYCMKAYPVRVTGDWTCEECEKKSSALPVQKKSEKGLKRKGAYPWENKVSGGKTKYIPVEEALTLQSITCNESVTIKNCSQAPRHKLMLKDRKKTASLASIMQVSEARCGAVSIKGRSSAPVTCLAENRDCTPASSSFPVTCIAENRDCTPASSSFPVTCLAENRDFTPASSSLWRGTFKVDVEYGEWKLHHVIEAHTPAHVLREIYELSMKMPEMLHFEAVPFDQYWIKLFENQTPDERDIGLYFFPSDWSSDGWYASFVESISLKKCALRLKIDNIELDVFTSKLLTPKCQRWKKKYYLWGVFNHIK